ncbi:hypothetical protein SLS61_008363 [Didymella pomorum]
MASPPQEPALLHRSLTHRPHEVVSASGSYLHLSDGRTILDACGGAAVSILGHGNPEVIAATLTQMQKASYVHTGSYTTRSAEDLARIVLSPHSDFSHGLTKAFFVGSGSEANDAAMKEGETESRFVERLVREAEEEFLRVGPETVISFIGETVSGATLGAMAAPRGYWPAIRALCDRYGILLHLDEVMCGTGRTGTYFAFEQEGIQPDIVTIGKGLGGGYAPIAGLLINSKIVDVLKAGSSTFNHGQTYQAHPTSCATALAVQEIVLRERLVGRCAKQGIKLEQLLRNTFKNSKYVGDIRGRGLFWCVEFMEDIAGKIPSPTEMAFGSKVQLAAFDLGIAMYPGAGTVDGLRGDHVLIAPPYTVSDEELEIMVSTLKKAYDQVVAELETYETNCLVKKIMWFSVARLDVRDPAQAVDACRHT